LEYFVVSIGYKIDKTVQIVEITNTVA